MTRIEAKTVAAEAIMNRRRGGVAGRGSDMVAALEGPARCAPIATARTWRLGPLKFDEEPPVPHRVWQVPCSNIGGEVKATVQESDIAV
jgi:hypothetical protein